MSVRNILNQSQLSVFQDAQIFLNSVRKQCYIQKINTFPPVTPATVLKKAEIRSRFFFQAVITDELFTSFQAIVGVKKVPAFPSCAKAVQSL